MTTYRYIQDPGHGWIEVPVSEIRELGLKPSHYSYTDGGYVYLEEDCDAGAWMKAREMAGRPVAREMLREVHQNAESHIRDMARCGDLRAQTMAGVLAAVGAAQ